MNHAIVYTFKKLVQDSFTFSHPKLFDVNCCRLGQWSKRDRGTLLLLESEVLIRSFVGPTMFRLGFSSNRCPNQIFWDQPIFFESSFALKIVPWWSSLRSCLKYKRRTIGQRVKVKPVEYGVMIDTSIST